MVMKADYQTASFFNCPLNFLANMYNATSTCTYFPIPSKAASRLQLPLSVFKPLWRERERHRERMYVHKLAVQSTVHPFEYPM